MIHPPAGRLAILLPALATVLPAAVASADPGGETPVFCVVLEAGTPVAADALETALVIERRKAGIDTGWVFRDAAGGCPSGGSEPSPRLEVGTHRARLVQGERVRLDFPIHSVPAPDRPAEIARRAFCVLGDAVASTPVPLGDGAFPGIRAAGSRAGGRPGGTTGYATVGGRYGWQKGPGLHLGGIEIEAGAAWLDERLSVGLEAGFLPRRQARTAPVDSSVESVPLVAMVRGGVRLRPFLLRLGAGVGVEWRRVQIRLAAYEATRSDASWLPVLDGEVEAVLRLAGRFRLALAATLRGYPKGTRYAWNGFPAFEPPVLMAGAVLRLGLSFGGGPR